MEQAEECGRCHKKTYVAESEGILSNGTHYPIGTCISCGYEFPSWFKEDKIVKFSELNKEQQEKEVNDYIQGWKETHPDEEISFEEARKLCIDSEDYMEE